MAGRGQVEVQGACGLTLVPQQPGDGDQLFQQGQVILQALQGRGHGAALRFAICQGGQGVQASGSHGLDLAAAEAIVLQLALRAEFQGDRQGCLDLPRLEGCGLGQGGAQQGQPFVPYAEGVGLLAQPEVKGTARGIALADGRRVHPKGPAPLALFEAKARQCWGVLACPGFQQQDRLGGEVGAFLGRQGLEGGPGGLGSGVEAVLGEQQVAVGRFAAVHRQAAGHVALGGELAHGVPVDQHLHHGGLLRLEMAGIGWGQFHRRQQTVVQGSGDQSLLLLFDLGQQRGGVPLEDALHATFR